MYKVAIQKCTEKCIMLLQHWAQPILYILYLEKIVTAINNAFLLYWLKKSKCGKNRKEHKRDFACELNLIGLTWANLKKSNSVKSLLKAAVEICANLLQVAERLCIQAVFSAFADLNPAWQMHHTNPPYLGILPVKCLFSCRSNRQLYIFFFFFVIIIFLQLDTILGNQDFNVFCLETEAATSAI